KNLERVAYFASYIIKSVDTEKREQLKADREAEFTAAETAINARYEAEAAKDGADVRSLAESRTRELEELASNAGTFKQQIDSLVKLNMLSETDYRNLPDDMRELIKVGMG